MKVFRRRLRLAVAAWLVFQVVSLSALVPRDCCDAHHVASTERAEPCHERADSSYCPMRSQGRDCPMHPQVGGLQTADAHAHHGAGADHAAVPAPAAPEHAAHAQSAREYPSTDRCTIGGTCSAPMTALAVILSTHGVIPAATLLPASPDHTPATPLPDERLTSRLTPPASPPPRA
jgi:hypothetical protein